MVLSGEITELEKTYKDSIRDHFAKIKKDYQDVDKFLGAKTATEEKVLMKGTEAMGEGALIAGCRYYYGYPITPQSELPAYLAWRLQQVDGVFLQAESEIAAIHMVKGAAATGVRAMTSSSSPDWS